MNNPNNVPAEQNSIAIKILSVAGGVLACLAFLGFLFITNLFESTLALCICGGIFISGAIWLSVQYGTVLLDTISISLLLAGGILLALGFNQFGVSTTLSCLIFMLIAAFALCTTAHQAINLVAWLTIHGGVIVILFENDLQFLLLGYIPFLALACYVAYAGLLALRVAVTLSLLSALYLLGAGHTPPVSPQLYWIASVGIIATLLYLAAYIHQQLVPDTREVPVNLLVLVALVLLPTLFAPSISGSLLIVFLGFQFGYRTGLVLGIFSGVYAISRYYYDLNFSLLTKSILLMASGALLLLLYFYVTPKLKAFEKQ